MLDVHGANEHFSRATHTPRAERVGVAAVLSSRGETAQLAPRFSHKLVEEGQIHALG